MKINLKKHIVEFNGEKYLPYDIVAKAYEEIYAYETNQAKMDYALDLIKDSVKSMSNILDVDKSEIEKLNNLDD